MHVLLGTTQNLPHYNPAGSLCRMERVPEGVRVSIFTELGYRSAEPDAIEKSLPTARDLRCDETCTGLVAEMVIVHVASVCEEGVEKCWSWHLP